MLEETHVLELGSHVYVMRKGLPVLEGTVTFHGIFGAQKKLEI